MNHPRQPLTPDLLRQFGKLGVRPVGAVAPAPAPAAEPDLLSTHELKARGWTATMIAKLLPREDATRPNEGRVGWSRKRLAAPVKLYALARVEAAETTEEFLIAQAAATKGRKAAGKAAATRAERLRAYIDGYTPALADAPEPLSGLALWRHHLSELTAYEHAHTDEWLALPRTAQRQGSSQLYEKHRTAFRARFGENY